MDFGSLPVSVVRRIDLACDKFEIAWRAGQRPRIEAFLGDVSEPGRRALLRALLATEIESRRSSASNQCPRITVLGSRRTPTSSASHSTRDLPRLPSVCQRHRLTLRLTFRTRARLSRSLTGAVGPLGKRIWAWPLVAVAIFAIAGFWVRVTIERVMRAQVASELLALRDADVEALTAPLRGARGDRRDRRE